MDWVDKNYKTYKSDENIKNFIDDIIKVYKKHGMSISHEDGHGAFEIEKYSDYNINWLKEATGERREER